MQMGDSALPLLREPHDSLRQGLPALKATASTSHPVEELQQKAKAEGSSRDSVEARHLYGAALPARLGLESQIAGRSLRLPGLGVPSSRFGLDLLSGKFDVITPEVRRWQGSMKLLNCRFADSVSCHSSIEFCSPWKFCTTLLANSMQDIYGRPEDSPNMEPSAHAVLDKGHGAKIATRHV